MKHCSTKSDAVYHERPSVKGWYHQLPDMDGGRSVIYAEVSGEHGQRIIGDKPRIYFVIEGTGEYTVNNEKFQVAEGDVVTIPPNATYNFNSTSGVLKVVLFMDLLDLNKIPKK